MYRLILWMNRNFASPAPSVPPLVSSNSAQEWEELAVLALFDHLPLRDLLHMGQTCRRFKHLQEKAARTRTKLQLSISNTKCGDFQDCHPLNCIHIPLLDRTTAKQLVTLLPNIEHLTIFHLTDQLDMYGLVPFLAWTDKIVHLEIYLWVQVEQSVVPLIEACNRLPNLKRLKIVYNGEICPNPASARPLDLSILSQLEHFFFRSNDTASILIPSFVKYATNNTALRSITVNILVHGADEMEQFLRFSPQLATKFTVLAGLVETTTPQLNRFCALFTSLTYLEIFVHYPTMRQLSVALKSLPNLTKLGIVINFGMRTRYRERALLNGEEIEPDSLDGAYIVPLPIVEQLNLYITLEHHSDIRILHFDKMFTNIKSCKLYSLDCFQCGVHFDADTFDPTQPVPAKLKRCLHLLHCTFRMFNNGRTLLDMFPTLRTLYLGPEGYYLVPYVPYQPFSAVTCLFCFISFVAVTYRR